MLCRFAAHERSRQSISREALPLPKRFPSPLCRNRCARAIRQRSNPHPIPQLRGGSPDRDGLRIPEARHLPLTESPIQSPDAAAIHFFASSIEAAPRSPNSLTSCVSRYEASFARMNSGTLITFNWLPAGHGRPTTDRSAAAENSDPSVAASIFNAPLPCRPTVRRGAAEQSQPNRERGASRTVPCFPDRAAPIGCARASQP